MEKAPALVRRFEGLTVLMIAIGAAGALIGYWMPDWNGSLGSAHTLGLGQVLAMQGFSICWTLFLTYFITRRKSDVAKWIFAVLVGLSVVFVFFGTILMYFMMKKVSDTNLVTSALLAPIHIYMIYLLFTPDFEAWIRKSKNLEPAGPAPWFLAGAGVFFLVLMATLTVRSMGKTFSQSIYTTLAKQNLKQSITAIEYYKQVHGMYPQALSDFAGKETNFLYDNSDGIKLPMKMHQYRLDPDGRHYVIFDVGADGVSGTADDIYPDIAADEAGHIGYAKE